MEEGRNRIVATVLAIIAAIIVLTINSCQDDGDSAANGTTTTATTTDDGAGTTTDGSGTGTDDGSGTGTDDGTATDDGGTGTDDGTGAATPLPAEVVNDPVVKRLARGRSLPFTAGPWRKAEWRDAVYNRLRPATQAVSTRIAQGQGFAIRIGG